MQLHSLTWAKRRVIQLVWDMWSWVFSVPVALLLRYDFSPPAGSLVTALIFGSVLAVTQVVIGLAFRLYRGRYVIGSFDEVLGVVLTGIMTAALGLIGLVIVQPVGIPRSTTIIALGISITSMLGARFVWRGARQTSALSKLGSRTLVYGAGDAGSQVVNLMLSDKTHVFQPVGFVDDDPNKRHLRRSGIKVLGTKADLQDILADSDVEVLLVAIARVTAQQLVELDSICSPLGVVVRIIPTAAEIAGGAVRLGDISEVTEEDLMGRQPINTDEHQIMEFIRGKRVLVTGAGGSIGSELCRQISRYRPANLYLLDRDESGLHAVQLTLDGTGTLDSKYLILADIRDQARIAKIFDEVQPELVFHSAALKHLPLLEKYPHEAYMTNVLGTRNVLLAAKESGTHAFVNISTDKAADPTSVLGFSKLITERLTAGASEMRDEAYVSVRFGNVLGSRGSVLHTFRHQIANGGPLTVTDENVTRYFMTIKEAVHLVLQASVLGKNGETLILDMGTAVNIAEMARYMIKRSGRDIEIRFTGIRPGEKMHEILVSDQEAGASRSHPLISHARISPIGIEKLDEFSHISDVYDRLVRIAAKP